MGDPTRRLGHTLSVIGLTTWFVTVVAQVESVRILWLLAID